MDRPTYCIRVTKLYNIYSILSLKSILQLSKGYILLLVSPVLFFIITLLPLVSPWFNRKQTLAIQAFRKVKSAQHGMTCARGTPQKMIQLAIVVHSCLGWLMAVKTSFRTSFFTSYRHL